MEEFFQEIWNNQLGLVEVFVNEIEVFYEGKNSVS